MLRRHVRSVAQRHQLAIESRVVAAVVLQPGVLHLERSRRRDALITVVLGHATDVDLGLLRLVQRSVNRRNRLQKLDIVFERGTRRHRDLANLCQRLGIVAGVMHRRQHALPRLGAVGVLRQHLLINRVGLLRISALQINSRKLDLVRDRRLLSCCGLLRNGLFEQILRDIEPLATLINSRNRRLEARLLHRLRVACRRHTFERLQRELFLSQGMLRAHQSLPGKYVVWVTLQHFAVESGGLLIAVCLLQQRGVLDARLGIEALAIDRHRKLQGRRKHALGVGIPPNRAVGRGEGTEVERIAAEFNPGSSGNLAF